MNQEMDDQNTSYSAILSVRSPCLSQYLTLKWPCLTNTTIYHVFMSWPCGQTSDPHSAGRLPATGHMTWKKKPRRLLGSLFGQTHFPIVITCIHCERHEWSVALFWLKAGDDLLQNVLILCRNKGFTKKNNPRINNVWLHTALNWFCQFYIIVKNIAHTNQIKK